MRAALVTIAAVIALIWIMGWITRLGLGLGLLLSMLVTILVSVLVSLYIRSKLTAVNLPPSDSYLEQDLPRPHALNKS